jgi:DNA-binding SARP family transcriptional activator
VAGLAWFAGDADAMLALTARELALWETVVGDGAERPLDAAERLAAARGRTLAHQLRALAHAMRGERAEAVSHMDCSVAVAPEAGDGWLPAVMRMRRALVHHLVGDHAAADADYRAAIPALHMIGEWWFLSLTHEGLAANALATGDHATAVHEGRLGVQVLREDPDPWFASRGLDTLAAALAARDAARPDAAGATTAARLLGAAAGLRRRCGVAVLGTDRERHEQVTAAVRARLGDASFAAAHAHGEGLTLDDAFALVSDDGHFARDDAPAAGAPHVGPGVHVGPAGTTSAPAVEHALRVTVLGPFAMAYDGVPLPSDALPVGKGRELLLHLLLHDRPAKEDVALALWPDASPARVRNLFHVTLHHLRRLLGEPRWIAFERNAYRLDRAPAPGLALDADVHAVLAASARLREAVRRSTVLDGATLDAARAALARRRGDLAEGSTAGEWLAPHRDRVHAAWADGMDALARQYAAAGRPAETLAVCEALVAREPLRESAHRRLLEALLALGEPARARAHYDALAALIAREVRASPARETVALGERLAR